MRGSSPSSAILVDAMEKCTKLIPLFCDCMDGAGGGSRFRGG